MEFKQYKMISCRPFLTPSLRLNAGRRVAETPCKVALLRIRRHAKVAALRVFGHGSSSGVPDETRCSLESIRKSLMHLDDRIITLLIERSRGGYIANSDTLTFAEHMTREMEKSFAKFRGFVEHEAKRPFFPLDLPKPIMHPPPQYPGFLQSGADSVNIDSKIWEIYLGYLVPRLASDQCDGVADVVWAAVTDAECLRLSRGGSISGCCCRVEVPSLTRGLQSCHTNKGPRQSVGFAHLSRS